MKKEIVQYATGKFKHFDGQDREFTVCAASISPKEEAYCNTTLINTEQDCIGTSWKRYLHFGISVRNPQDQQNEIIAKKIAYGKAHSKKGYTVAFDDCVLMSTQVANVLLHNFASRVANDPSLAIENYEVQKESYLKKCQKEENS